MLTRLPTLILLFFIILSFPSYILANLPKTKFHSPTDFVTTIYPFAKKAAEEIGLDPKVLVAQAAHETSWGKRIPRCKDGSSSHNLFGIKASPSSLHKSAISKTKEFQKGKMIKVKAGFRAYNDYEAAFNDYVAMLQRSKRYEHALKNTNDPYTFLIGLQTAGYATDPKYAKKIYDVYRHMRMG